MRWSDISWRPPASTLRWFAAIWLIWFAVLASAAWWRGNDTSALVFLGVALLIGALGIMHPPAVRIVYLASLMLTFPVGWLVSHLLLAVVFYCVFTPLGLFFRLIGRDVLGRHLERGPGSYWSPKREAKDLRDYFRQS
jgi:hypothetical protein